MNKLILTLPFLALATSAEGAVLQNQGYRLEVSADVIQVSRLASPAQVREIRPELTVQFAAEDPHYQGGSVSGWKSDGQTDVRNFWQVGSPAVLQANALRTNHSASVELDFPAAPAGQLTLTVSLAEGMSPPAFSWRFTAAKAGWFSVGFTGLAPQDPAHLDFLYQPLIWSWKRFPETPGLTPESFATTALTFVNAAGLTEGLAPDVSEIPYRFATFANSRFGLALRDEAGRARPMLFAPILGGAESKLAVGESCSFKVRYLLQPGDWYAGVTHFYREVAGYRNERENATCTLNQTFENLVDFALSDAYSGWVEDLKGSDYRFDAPGTVKNVAASHALSVALTTGNLEIYRRRALPMMEYLLSREKYLYAINEEIKTQNPSHFLRGPAVEIGELAALHELTGGHNAVFAREAARLLGQPRKLNLNTATGGGSWQDYLACYRLTQDPQHLARARELADHYLAESVWKYPTNFVGSAGLRDPQAGFATDYTPHFHDLLELHEETGDARYLNAAVLAARQFLLWLRSNPMAPDTNILVNAGGRVPGVFPGRRHQQNSDEFKPYDTSTLIPEQRVAAWRTSLVGLPPEQGWTYQYGPIMLAHHAAWLLRLGQLSQDPWLGEAANNAVLGRYANFPGYYFTSLHTTVYQQRDYPLRPYLDIKYNAIFYNHIWPHIALLQDFLVSEAFAKSHGRVSFPSAYAPGYAYLSSKVYGHRSGEVFGNPGVQLWLPPRALQSSSVALNHLFGISVDDTYLVLSNTRREEVAAELRLDADILHLQSGINYPLTCYRTDGRTEAGTLRDGKLSVRVGPEGLVAIKIHGLKNTRAISFPLPLDAKALSAEGFFRTNHAAPLGTVTGMLLRLGDQRTDAYLYTDTTERQARRFTLHYRIGDQPEETLEDTNYPYEFSIPMPDAITPLQCRLVAEDLAGKSIEVNLPTLRSSP